MSATLRRRALLSAGLVAATSLVLTGCASAPSGASGTAGSATSSTPSDQTDDAHDEADISHIHGLGRDPQSGQVVIATHEGLYRLQDGRWRGGGQVVDLMGFAIAPDGVYLGSGHPGPGVDLPEPGGLLESRDGGRTWSSVSRGGESDFHTLTAGAGFVMGFDGTLRISTDRTTWREAAIDAEPHNIAASPGTGTVLATTERGLLSSADQGATWTRLDPPQLLVVVAWADDRTIVGAGVDGRLHTSTDAGQTWTSGGATIGRISAIAASRTPDGAVETLLVIDTTVLRTTDGGGTTEQLG